MPDDRVTQERKRPREIAGGVDPIAPLIWIGRSKHAISAALGHQRVVVAGILGEQRYRPLGMSVVDVVADLIGTRTRSDVPDVPCRYAIRVVEMPERLCMPGKANDQRLRL